MNLSLYPMSMVQLLLVHLTGHLLGWCMVHELITPSACICTAAASQQLQTFASWIIYSCRALLAGCLLLQAKAELVLLLGNLLREKALPSGQPCSARFVFTAEAPVEWLAELCTVFKARILTRSCTPAGLLKGLPLQCAQAGIDIHSKNARRSPPDNAPQGCHIQLSCFAHTARWGGRPCIPSLQFA